MPDGSSRFSINGKPIYHYMGTSTFANHTVVPEIALAKIRTDAPFDKVCYIGCGVTTGLGAVINTAKVEPGSNCIVFGLGGIGLNVLQGLRMVGANMIVGVDLNDDKKAWGEQFGMTHFVNPSKIQGDLTAHLVELTNGGGDYTFECIGNADARRAGNAHKGWAKHHHRRCRCRQGDLHPSLPTRDGAVLARYRIRRCQRPNRCAEDRRLVYGRQDSD